MRILSLDVSSHTGYSILEDENLISYGKLEIPCGEDNSWPLGIHAWAKRTAKTVCELIEKTECDIIVIERANSSSWRSSQNFLDWSHGFFIDICLEKGYFSKVRYIDSAKWRKICGIKLNSEQKKQNKLARQANKAGTTYKVDGKRKGIVSKKHLALNMVNEKYGLKLKVEENDQAESILLGLAYIKEPF